MVRNSKNPKLRKAAMIKKKIIDKERIRLIAGGCAFIPHRFLTGGFFSDLSRDQLLLHFFLILTAGRFGLSFYSYDKEFVRYLKYA